jgi:hypothetical protein
MEKEIEKICGLCNKRSKKEGKIITLNYLDR